MLGPKKTNSDDAKKKPGATDSGASGGVSAPAPAEGGNDTPKPDAGSPGA